MLPKYTTTIRVGASADVDEVGVVAAGVVPVGTGLVAVGVVGVQAAWMNGPRL